MTKEVIVELARIYDYVYFVLPTHGHVTYVKRKIKLLIKNLISFEWYTCRKHVDDIKDNILNTALDLIIKKNIMMIYTDHSNSRKD